MDIPSIKNRYYSCEKCNKDYSSYKSLWNHNKKFHDNYINQNQLLSTIDQPNINQNQLLNGKYNCRYCSKSYDIIQSRWKHEQKCKNILKDKNDRVKILEETIDDLKQQITNILKEKGHLHHKTLQKFNNQVTNTIQNMNINNGTIINNTYVKFGDICYEKIFSNSEILSILNKQYMALEEGISKTHFNDSLPEYSNIFITNLRDDVAYVFNGKEFITVKKHEILNELIDTHINEINLSFEKNKNKLKEKYAERIEKFLNKLNDNYTKYTDPENNRTYSNYKAYKMDAIKLAIYNGSDKKKLEALKNIKLFEKIDSDVEL
jgi:hypothetical protein